MDRASTRAENAALAARLARARIDAGMTQAEVANRLSKPQSFVAKYEAGERRLTAVEFVHVCRALEVTPASIMRDIERVIVRGSDRRFR